MSLSISHSARLAATVVLLPWFALTAAVAAPPLVTFGTYLKPFSAESPWNRQPIAPVLGTEVVPKSDYYPTVAAGGWSTGVFLARRTDAAMVVHGMPGKSGVWDVDAEEFRDIAIPRWPVDIASATESDGHADIVDEQMGIVHSFWQLKRSGDQWTAAQYAWARIDGTGWGDPAHYFQGARAAGVPTSGGLIRKHEVEDGDVMYRHALALSLTYNALSANPPYIYPATSADSDAASTNKGRIPEGALLMLPQSFDAQKLGTPELRKVAETLKSYGAYVVDRNTGTPYVIYVEIDARFSLHKTGWSNTAATDLQTIREALRPVVSTDGWQDGNGRKFVPSMRVNLLSMRGPWKTQSADGKGRFDDWSQSVVFPRVVQRIEMTNDTGRGLNPVRWAIPKPGESYELRAIATGGARLRMEFRELGSGKVVRDTGEMEDGRTVTFPWPDHISVVVHVLSGTSTEASSVRGELTKLPSKP